MANETIREWQRDVHTVAIGKGWWNSLTPENRSLFIGCKILEIMAEGAEAAEEVRVGLIPDEIREDDHGKPAGFAIELADIVIRTMDLAEYLDIDLDEVMRIKHEYNKTRSYKHGDKAF